MRLACQVAPPERQRAIDALLRCMGLFMGKVGFVALGPLRDKDQPRGNGDASL